MAELVQVFREQANKLGDFLIEWARPQGWPESPLSVSFLALEFEPSK